MTMKIGFIGSGNMAQSLVKAIKKTKIANKIIASDNQREQLKKMKEIGVEITKDNKKIMSANIIFLCVKPQIIEKVLGEIKNDVQNQIIVSVAAGKTIKKMEKIIPSAKIVRVMPNILCEINEMSSTYTPNDNCTREDVEQVEKILESIGSTIQVREEEIATYTIIAGSSPAFFAHIALEFVQEAKRRGLDEEKTKKLLYQVLKGTGQYLMQDEELIKKVTSPEGITQAGLDALKNNEINKTIKDVFTRAIKRSDELN